MKHPGHTYGGFVPAISERGMTLTLYHPHLASDGGVCVPQLDVKSLDLALSGQ
jgi:hypothetical protein